MNNMKSLKLKMAKFHKKSQVVCLTGYYFCWSFNISIIKELSNIKCLDQTTQGLS